MTYAHASSARPEAEAAALAVPAKSAFVRIEQISMPLLLALVAAYLLPGLIGPHLWKPDEPYFFGMVWSLLQGGDWIVPTLAGEPFMEKPPLLMWVAVLTSKLASPLLTPHDGARLTTGLFMVLTIAITAQTARRWWGLSNGRLAILSLLASMGLIQYSHTLLADIPLLAGFAVALYGFSLVGERPVRAGALLGTGVGIGFLSKGLIAPGAIGVVGVLLPILFAPWRTRAYLKALAVALLAATPWLILWPAALYFHSHDLFMEWFWTNNIGRFLGFSVPQLGAAKDPWQWETTLPWFTFPVLPLALWTVWKRRGEWRTHMGMQSGLLMAGAIVATLLSSASARTVYALPLLAPLAVLAVPALESLSAHAGMIIDWFSRVVFGAVALFIWTVWGITLATGIPPQWAFVIKRLPKDYPFASIDWSMIAALVLLLGWLWLMRVLPKLDRRGLVSWVAGLALAWGTGLTLWLPWLNASKSYDVVFTQMQKAVPAHVNCIASHGLGESERAMLHYVTGITTERLEIHKHADCDLVFAQSVITIPPTWWMEHGWTTLWEGSRTDEHRQRFWLLARPGLVAR